MYCQRCYETPCECNPTEIYSGLRNYYGGVFVYEKDGKYFMGLEDHSHDQRKEISKEFYDAFVKEFKDR